MRSGNEKRGRVGPAFCGNLLKNLRRYGMVFRTWSYGMKGHVDGTDMWHETLVITNHVATIIIIMIIYCYILLLFDIIYSYYFDHYCYSSIICITMYYYYCYYMLLLVTLVTILTITIV